MAIKDNRMAMSREIIDFSNLIDEQFDFVEEPVRGFIQFILSLFR